MLLFHCYTSAYRPWFLSTLLIPRAFQASQFELLCKYDSHSIGYFISLHYLALSLNADKVYGVLSHANCVRDFSSWVSRRICFIA